MRAYSVVLERETFILDFCGFLSWWDLRHAKKPFLSPSPPEYNTVRKESLFQQNQMSRRAGIQELAATLAKS